MIIIMQEQYSVSRNLKSSLPDLWLMPNNHQLSFQPFHHLNLPIDHRIPKCVFSQVVLLSTLLDFLKIVVFLGTLH